MSGMRSNLLSAIVIMNKSLLSHKRYASIFSEDARVFLCCGRGTQGEIPFQEDWNSVHF